MISLSIYIGHNNSTQLKAFGRILSKSDFSDGNNTLYISAMYHPITRNFLIIGHNLPPEKYGKPMLPAEAAYDFADFFPFINKVKQDYMVTHVISYLDANLGKPGHSLMTPEAVSLVNKLEASSIWLFSTTPACLQDTREWAAHYGYIDRVDSLQSTREVQFLDGLTKKPLNMSIVEFASSSIDSHLSLIKGLSQTIEYLEEPDAKGIDLTEMATADARKDACCSTCWPLSFFCRRDVVSTQQDLVSVNSKKILPQRKVLHFSEANSEAQHHLK